MKKKTQDQGTRKLQLHKETLHKLLLATGGDDPSITCMTCPDHNTATNNCGACGG
jgi:hypothetical protein